jgi:hypothetical protein
MIDFRHSIKHELARIEESIKIKAILEDSFWRYDTASEWSKSFLFSSSSASSLAASIEILLHSNHV